MFCVHASYTTFASLGLLLTEASTSFQTISCSEESSSETMLTSESDTENGGNTPKNHCSTRTGTTAFIPHNIMKSPTLVSLRACTPTQQAVLIETVIKEAGGDAT